MPMNHTIEMTYTTTPVDSLRLDPFAYSFVQPSLNKSNPKTVIDEATTVLKMEVFAFFDTLIKFYLLEELVDDNDQLGSAAYLMNYMVNEQGVLDHGGSDVHRELDCDMIRYSEFDANGGAAVKLSNQNSTSSPSILLP